MKKAMDQIELVETGNIARCLRRTQEQSKPYQTNRWKRMLLHAIAMAEVSGFDEQRKIREALGLP